MIDGKLTTREIEAYHQNLLESSRAKEFLVLRRLIRKNVARKFMIGYGGDDQWSPFRDRVLFPFRDIYGNIVSAQGRALFDYKAANTGKYWHLPFKGADKSRYLYGLYENGQAILDGGVPILVEGPMCVLAGAHCGIPVVAALGTGFGVEQALLLRRFTDKVITWYDNDAAGAKAQATAHQVLSAHDIKVVAARNTTAYKDLGDVHTAYGQDAVITIYRDAIGRLP